MLPLLKAAGIAGIKRLKRSTIYALIVTLGDSCGRYLHRYKTLAPHFFPQVIKKAAGCSSSP
jgi:hypothetical protein